MYKNNQLIPTTQNNLIPKVTTTLSITHKLFVESKRNIILSIFLKNPKFFINSISRFYPLKKHLIEKYNSKWNEDLLFYNENIIWDINLIINLNLAEYIKDLKNPMMPWEEIIENEILLNILIEQEIIIGFKNFPWTIELIDKYKDKWIWSKLESWKYENFNPDYDDYSTLNSLSSNISLPWSIEFIEKFKDYLDWEELSLNESVHWSLELIKEFYDYWNWKSLSFNKELPWSINLIEKYKEKWDWNYLSCNKGIPWSENILKKYNDLINYDKLWGIRKSIISTETFFDTIFERKIWVGNEWMQYVDGLSDYYEEFKTQVEFDDYDVYIFYELFSEDLNWKSEFFIEENIIDEGGFVNLGMFKIHFGRNWQQLSRNTKLPWSIELIEKHKDKWDWFYLSMNSGIKINLEIFEKFNTSWNGWNPRTLGLNKNISVKIIEKYPYSCVYEKQGDYEKNYYTSYLYNEYFPWTIDLIEEKSFDLFWKDNNRSSIRKIFAKNTLIPWSEELLNKYKRDLDWNHLTENDSVPWSLDLINKFAIHLTYSQILWDIVHVYIDDDLIEEVFNKMKNQ
jgi:hypothetical protein